MPNRLIICLDGTWNSTFNEVEREDGTQVLKPTNPLKVARAILPVDPDGDHQITYYDSGVGALGKYPGFSNWMLHFVDTNLGGGFGAGFEANVEQAANFLALNYVEGMDILIFGFSRGAAQARALTHFLDWMGGIPAKSDAYYVPVFFRHYIDSKGKGTPMDVVSSTGNVPAERMLPLKINFLGVWDTVMAIGSRLLASVNTSVQDRAFHVGSKPAECVLNARQALAIDEKRYDFRPEVWQSHEVYQTLEQRWFPGAHANIGGSYENDGLANGALDWVVNEAKRFGLVLDDRFLSNYNPFPQDRLGDPHTLLYKVIETLRFKRNRGVRELDAFSDEAQLSFDPSAIQRFCSDPNEFDGMKELYRPQSLVRVLCRHQLEWSEFLQDLGLDPASYPFPSDI